FFEADTEGVALHSELAVQPESIIIEKHFPNSIFQIEHQETLQQQDIDTLVICGIMTHMCVDSTTRAASELGYNPIFIHDASDVQHALIASLTNFSTVMSTDE
ncbi:isochorismatase family protein, partial [Staphylococcus pseudintermedius]